MFQVLPFDHPTVMERLMTAVNCLFCENDAVNNASAELCCAILSLLSSCLFTSEFSLSGSATQGVELQAPPHP